jgi:hypothetical protein
MNRASCLFRAVIEKKVDAVDALVSQVDEGGDNGNERR